MTPITVWTKQHRCVLEELQKTGRYVAKRDHILQNEDAYLMHTAYDWLVRVHPDRANCPADADYPIWVSERRETTMLLSADTVILELAVDPARITSINIAKWGMINNFSYIPANPADEKRHKQLLKDLGVSDAKAYMSRFYPELKQEIEDSWMRAFDDSIQPGNQQAYGLIWELRREWIQCVIQ